MPLIKQADFIDFGGLTALGEPLLSPHFKEIICYIRKINKSATLSITTNAVLLDKEMSIFLINQAPLKITFSFHAVSQQVYQRLMGRDFKKVKFNLETFCWLGKNNKSVIKIINFGIGKHNYQESLKLIDFAKKNQIDTIQIYPYYKSPNSFIRDVSLYHNPALANQTLKKVYRYAKTVGQKLSPDKPQLVNKVSKLKTKYQGGCLSPYNYFILKADPLHQNRLALGICNRIMLFLVDYSKKITKKDLLWAWLHPAIRDLRLAKPGTIPEICKFCKDPQTAVMRSTDYQQYKKSRDRLVENHLTKWQSAKHSPNKSIVLLKENVFTL